MATNNLDFNIFVSNKEKLSPSKGSILIANPFLRGDIFERSIILLIEHNEKGSIGLVINKVSNVYPDEIIDDLLSFTGSLHFGGPISRNNLYFIHTLGNKVTKSEHLYDNLYWGGNFKELTSLINNNKADFKDIKFFAGYSGWIEGQLEQELKDDTWVVTNLSVEDIMSENTEDIWSKTLYKLGGIYRAWSNFPRNPELN